MITQNDVDTLPGATVYDTDGDKVGSVGQVYVSEDGSEPLFITVKTGLFGMKETFVPLDGATFTEEGLRVMFDQQVIKDAPKIDADQSITDDEQSTLFDYYDRSAGGTPASRTGDAYDRPADGTVSGGAMTDAAPADATVSDGATYDTDATYDTASGTDTAYDADATGTAAAPPTSTADDGPVGRDTSGPTTDDAITLSKEQLNVGVQKVETGRARLRKHIVTEQQTVTVPVSHDEVRIEREPITDANVGDALDGPELSEEEHEVVLTEERPVVDTEVVPVERVRLATETVTEQRDVTQDVRHEEIETDGFDAGGTGTTSR